MKTLIDILGIGIVIVALYLMSMIISWQAVIIASIGTLIWRDVRG